MPWWFDWVKRAERIRGVPRGSVGGLTNALSPLREHSNDRSPMPSTGALVADRHTLLIELAREDTRGRRFNPARPAKP